MMDQVKKITNKEPEDLNIHWSFDDYHIGRSRDSNRCLATKEIPRPAGLSNREWYEHAAKICTVLNAVSVQKA